MWKSYLKTDKRVLSFPPLMWIHLSLLQAKKIKFCTTISAGIFILRVVEKEVIRDWRAPLALGYGRNFWNIETLQKVLLNQRYRTGKSLLFGLIYGRHREGYMILQEAGVALILESAWKLLSRVWWDHIDRGVIEWTHTTQSRIIFWVLKKKVCPIELMLSCGEEETTSTNLNSVLKKHGN